MDGEKYYYGLEKLELVKDEQQRNRIIEEALEAVKKNTAVLKDRYQQDLLSVVIRQEQKERERIAQNLHDELGTQLSLSKINLLKKAEQAGVSHEFIGDLEHVLDTTIEAVKSITNDLISPTLKVFGFLKAVEELGAQESWGAIQIKVTNRCNKLHLAHEAEVQLFRILKEVVNNILKHAKATSINIVTGYEGEKLAVAVSHNGLGISSAEVQELLKQSRGMGLKSIFSRAIALNASVNYLVQADRAEVIITI